MEKIINIDGRDVKFKSTGASLLRYKAQFLRDPLRDILGMTKAVEERTVTDETGQMVKKAQIADLDAFDLEVFYNLVWVMAKTADKSLPPPMEWLDEFSEFPLMEIVPEIMELFNACISGTRKNREGLPMDRQRT